MAVKVTVKSDLSTKWYEKKKSQWNSAELRMATDILRLATVYAPVDKGHLRASGRIERNDGKGLKVAFGGSGNGFAVPYARLRHFQNRKNPQTLRYLERAGEQVAKDKDKYIKDAK